MIYLKRYGSVWDRNERINQNDNLDTIERTINDRGAEILSDSTFLNWLDENGVKHLGEWDDTKEYDRFSVVLHEGNSYTSKAYVPEGIDILNEDFWIVTGNYNAQVEQYRQDVSRLEKLNLIDISNPPGNLSPLIPDGTTDNRIEFQTLIDYASINGYEGIYVPFSESSYKINVNHTDNNRHQGSGLQIPSNFKFIMHPDAIISALETDFTFHVMINVHDAENVLIKGGILEGERKFHETPNQYGYGIYIHGSENVMIENVYSRDWWGDCFVTRDKDIDSQTSKPCRNIHFNKVVADNGSRQGLSVISGKGVIIENSTFKNTNGTAPEAGIDIEPNYDEDPFKVENITIRNCIFENNNGFSIVGSRSRNVSIEDNLMIGGRINLLRSSEDVRVINNNTDYPVVILSKKALIKNNIIKNVISTSAGLTCDNTFDDFKIIEGNHISNCNRGVVFSDNAKNIIFQGNTIQGSSDYGVLMNTSNNENIIFRNNVLEKNKGFNQFRMTKAVISDNTFIDNEHSLYMNIGSYSIIKNNVFKTGDNTLDGDRFITVGSGCEGVVIDGNIFDAEETHTISPVSVTNNADRVKPVMMSNNVSNKDVPQFVTPEGGMLSVNNTIIGG